MKKVKMQSFDVIGSNVNKIAQLFPSCVTERLGKDGKPELAIDFEKLQAELSNDIIAEGEERYQFTWPEKRKTINIINQPTSKTLRPFKGESKDFDKTKNIFIEGDNMDVLKVLQETYLNKVKLVYMDPPYNAGQDLLYKNKYEMTEDEFKLANFDIDEDGYILSLNSNTNGRYHTDWINMMYSRIKLARNLLKNDGCIVLAIDDNELINLSKICDEIFGERNRIGIITVVHKPEGRNQERWFATSNEFALFYAKDINNFDLEPAIIDKDILSEYEYCDDKGQYKLISYIAKNHGREGYDKNLRVNSPNRYYPLYVSPDLKSISLNKLEGYTVVYPNTKTQERTWKYILTSFEQKLKQGEFVALKENGEIKIYEKYRIDNGQLIKTHWIDKRYNAMVYGTKVLDDLMKVKTFDFPKSIYLMEDIIRLTTKNNDIIFDIFSGSATTVHACFNSNIIDGYERRFVSIQLPVKCDEKSVAFINGYTTITSISKERIRRAGKKVKEEVGKKADKLDIGFRVLKLDSSNMEDVYYTPSGFAVDNLFSENIKADRTSEDLLFQVMLSYGIELSAKIETQQINGKTVHFVDDNFLIACFDKDVNESTITEIAKLKPIYFVMRDASADSDNVIDNFEQIFRHYSPETKRQII